MLELKILINNKVQVNKNLNENVLNNNNNNKEKTIYRYYIRHMNQKIDFNLNNNSKEYNENILKIKVRGRNYLQKLILEEVNNLYDNDILTFIKFLSSNKTIVFTKWVFSTKKNTRGFNQGRGIDYDLTYSPTLNIDCLIH
ncbi:hypothetical protein H8356DRAFT_1328222 [Neocallimastix lanati (nom. inval.)]|nr:hypothetical protein H8356DRAFT_1328222 [Neocallimastix sp. JGI-2020a]